MKDLFNFKNLSKADIAFRSGLFLVFFGVVTIFFDFAGMAALVMGLLLLVLSHSFD